MEKSRTISKSRKTKNYKNNKKDPNKISAVRIIIIAIIFLMITVSIYWMTTGSLPFTNKQKYSTNLQERIQKELSNTNASVSRPDYLPPEMFSRLPTMPADFYKIRELVRVGRMNDFSEINESIWLQPEFFPHYEDIGVKLLQNPNPDRWGANGIAIYPSDSVSSLKVGDTTEMYFFIKSNYLVETYQGIKFTPTYPANATIISGYTLPDGTKNIIQDPAIIATYFTVKTDSEIFILEPNFPIYNVNGTRKIKLTVTVKNETPPGNYLVGVDLGDVPQSYEKEWTKKYLNLYTSGSLTKLDRPYYQAFISVVKE